MHEQILEGPDTGVALEVGPHRSSIVVLLAIGVGMDVIGSLARKRRTEPPSRLRSHQAKPADFLQKDN
jgi:hypothetical protein